MGNEGRRGGIEKSWLNPQFKAFGMGKSDLFVNIGTFEESNGTCYALHRKHTAIESMTRRLPSIAHNPDHQGLRLRRRGFTLLEMLVVVTIVSIMVGVTAGVTGAINGSKGSTAILQVSAILDEARGKALTGQGEVVVAFATETVPEAGMAFRAMVICQAPLTGGGSSPDFQPISGWYVLPEGFVFARAQPADWDAGVNVFDAKDSRVRVTVPGALPTTLELPCIGFRELGELTRPRETRGKPVLVAVAEGEVDGGGPRSPRGLEHDAAACRWVAVQRNSGTTMILP